MYLYLILWFLASMVDLSFTELSNKKNNSPLFPQNRLKFAYEAKTGQYIYKYISIRIIYLYVLYIDTFDDMIILCLFELYMPHKRL